MTENIWSIEIKKIEKILVFYCESLVGRKEKWNEEK